MKKNYIKLLLMLLIFTLCIGFMPIQAQAASSKAAVKISLNKSRYVLKKGEKLKLKAAISPAKSKSKTKLKWKSSNAKVASVTQKGVVTAKAKKGTAKITVSSGGKKASCKITVGVPVKKITASDITIALGKSVKLNASVSPKKASIKKLVYESSQPEIVSVDASGNITAQKAGTAKITITAADRGKVKKRVQVTVIGKTPDPDRNPEIKINVFSDETSNIVTEENITVTGSAAAYSAAIETVSYSLKYAMDSEASVSGTAKGVANWSIENLPLQIGTNILTVTAKDTKNCMASKEIIFNRLSTEIELSERVVIFDEEENAEVSDSILDYWTDDMGTEDTSDDLVILLFHENAELVQSMKEGRMKTGDVVMLQPCEELYLGFSGIVVSHADPQDTVRYPADEFEVISFQAADMTDIFNSDVSLSYEIADVENPLAFAYFPADVEIASLDDFGRKQSVLYASEGIEEKPEEAEEELEGQKISEAGFQKNAVSYMMEEGLKLNGGVSGSAGLNLGLTFQDTVFYDKDGKAATTNDQFVIGGEMAFENFKVDAGVEWHTDFWKGELLPQQIIGKFTYNHKVDLHAEWEGQMDFGDLAKEANTALTHNYENKTQFLGINFSGIDMSNSIILGMFGLKISPAGVNPTIGFKNTQDSSLKNKLSAIVVVIPVIDVTGKITAKVGFTYKYSAYHENGINMQKKDFVGAYGSLEENKGQYSVDLPLNRSLEIYDVCARSSSHKDADPGWSASLSGEGEASQEVGVGVDLGLMISGIIPASVKARIYEKSDLKASGEVKLGNGLKELENADVDEWNKVSVKAEGAINAHVEAGAKIGAYFKLKAEKGGHEIKLESPDKYQDIKYLLCELTIASVSGTVVKESADMGGRSYEPLEGVKVRLQENKPGGEGGGGGGMGGRSKETPIEVYSDAEGKFVFPNIKDGDYKLIFSKDGYVSYTKEFTVKGENQEFNVKLEPEGFHNTLLKLIDEQGIFKANQSGTMTKREDAWFHPEGIISAKIMDFDSDGKNEMLVCDTKPYSGDPDCRQIYLNMYEIVDGKVILADSVPYSAYQSSYDTYLCSSEDTELFCGFNAVNIDGTWCLVCEEDGEWRVFGDEMAQNYWILTYQNQKFRYEASLTGVPGVFFGFIGYEFSDGRLNASKLYYGDEYGEEEGMVPLYDEFAVALTEFFKKYKISLKNDVDLIRDVELGSILSEQNEKVNLFQFTNKLVEEEEEEGYRFTAVLKRDEMDF